MKLTVRHLQPGDFGNYRCISKNSLGETEGSIRLYGEYFFVVRYIERESYLLFYEKSKV